MSDTMEDPGTATEEEPVDPWADPRVTAGGSPETGWIVDVHDGNRHEVYRLAGGTEEEAKQAALTQFQNEEPTPTEDPLAKALAEFKKNAENALAKFDAYGQEALTAFGKKADKALADFKKAVEEALEACKPPKADTKGHDTKHDDKKK